SPRLLGAAGHNSVGQPSRLSGTGETPVPPEVSPPALNSRPAPADPAPAIFSSQNLFAEASILPYTFPGCHVIRGAPGCAFPPRTARALTGPAGSISGEPNAESPCVQSTAGSPGLWGR